MFLGNCSSEAVLEFWTHCKKQSAWQHHSVLHSMSDTELRRAIPCSIHVDGAEMYRDSEFTVWSWSSNLGIYGMWKDVLVQKYVIGIIPNHEMVDENAP